MLLTVSGGYASYYCKAVTEGRVFHECFRKHRNVSLLKNAVLLLVSSAGERV